MKVEYKYRATCERKKGLKKVLDSKELKMMKEVIRKGGYMKTGTYKHDRKVESSSYNYYNTNHVIKI